METEFTQECEEIIAESFTTGLKLLGLMDLNNITAIYMMGMSTALSAMKVIAETYDAEAVVHYIQYAIEKGQLLEGLE